jgi:glycolate oxidase FAD binding subunit
VAPSDSAHPADGIPAELTKACPDVTAASPADAVGGRQARYVAAPASAGEAAAALAAADTLGLTVIPRGSGSRLDWGMPPATCDLLVDTRRLDRVIEHAAGDLVVSVEAGVRLGDLASVLASAGQRLALDPPAEPASGDAGGTVGGLIATSVAGPLRYRYGTPRDLLIGITVVRSDGTIAKSGGKVVKNVAGYDLGKLFAGSYGTLGLITEATFRLHPLPAAATWLTVECPDPAAAQAAAQLMADSPLAPSAIELDWPSAAASISVSVLLEGDDQSVANRTERITELLERQAPQSTQADRAVADAEAAVGPFRLARPPVGRRGRSSADATLLRVAFWTGQLASVLSAIRSAAADGEDPAISGSAGAGVLEVSLPPEMGSPGVARYLTELRASLAGLAANGTPPARASAVVLRAPSEVRNAVNMWGPVPSADLMRAVKDQFDPRHRMAPGRFAGGI